MKKTLVQKTLLGVVAVLGLTAAGVGTADAVIRPCFRNFYCLDVWMQGSDERTRVGIPGTWSIAFGPDLNTARIESAWDASIRARAGFLLTPKTLVYSTGGLALMHQEVSATCDGTFPTGWCAAPNADSISAIATGWTAGGGIERMLGHAWIVRGEYRYSDYGSRSFTLFEDAPLDSVGVTIEQKTSLAYVGVSRRF